MSLSLSSVIMIAAVSAEDLLNSDTSAVEQAFVLATTLFQEEDTTAVLNSREIAGIVITAIVVVFLFIVMISIVTVYSRLKR